MSTIRTPRYRDGAQVAPRLVHNWCFLESAVPPALANGTPVIRDYASQSDLILGATTSLSWNADGSCNWPLGAAGSAAAGLVDIQSNAFSVVIVGNLDNITSIHLGNAGFPTAGITFDTVVPAALSGVYTTGTDALIDLSSITTTGFGGISLSGDVGGTLTVESYNPGGSIVSEGTVSMATLSSMTFLNDIVDGSGSDVSGILVATGQSVSVSLRQQTLIDYTEDLNNGINRLPDALDDIAF